MRAKPNILDSFVINQSVIVDETTLCVVKSYQGEKFLNVIGASILRNSRYQTVNTIIGKNLDYIDSIRAATKQDFVSFNIVMAEEWMTIN